MRHQVPRDVAKGLTLIELMVVLAVLGLASATVAVRLGDTLGPAALQQSISQWEFTDQQLRTRARRAAKPVAVFLELGTSRIECAFDVQSDAPRTVRSLARGVRITKYVSSTHEVSVGTLSIAYDDRGNSETFAIEFTGRQGKQRWLLVAGLTGQITEVTDEGTARELLQRLLAQSVHAG